MTIPSTSRKAGPLLGTGVQTLWPFTFKVFAESDIQVTTADSLGTETVRVLGTDYSVALNANQETSPGGTVTYPISGAPLPTSGKLTIVGDIDYDQPLDLPSGGNFSPLALENQLDRTVMQVQQLEERLDRALTVPATSTASSALPAPEANKLIGWNETATGLQNLSVSEIASVVAYGTAASDIFTGTGVQTAFVLTYNPGALNNLDISIGGVTQLPGIDYTWASGTTVTFTSAPPLGAKVLIRYMQALSLGTADAGSVQYTPAGTGAVPTTVQTKLRESVSVKDFGAVGDNVADDTVKVQAALNSGAKVVNLVPGENYKTISSLTVPAGVFIQGNGATITSTTHFKVLDFASGGGVFNLNMTGAGGAAYTAGSIAIGCSGTNNAPSAPTYVAGPTIENCTISGFGEYGVFLEYVKIAKVKGNNITAIGYAGVGGVSCEDVIVDGNTIKNITAGSPGGDAYGVFIDRNNGTSETAEPRSYRCVITNNIIENISSTAGDNGHAIDTHAGVQFVIDGNQIANCEGGIYVTASQISGSQALGPKRCVISNNVISGGFTTYGIIVYGARSGGFLVDAAEDCVVSGNTIFGHGSRTEATGTVPALLLSYSQNTSVTGNVFKNSGACCIMLDEANIAFNISGNVFVDPQSTTFSVPSCIRIYSDDNRGYIGGNSFRYQNASLATYVAVNSIRIESALTGLDLDFGRSSFVGIDATHLTFNAATTTGVRYFGLAKANGTSTISVSNGVADGITDVTFAKRLPYAPSVSFTLRRPFNQGGQFPILGLDTAVVPTAAGFRIYALPYDGTTWSANGNLTFDWSAE